MNYETNYYGVYIHIEGSRHWIRDIKGNEVFTGTSVDQEQIDKFVSYYK